MTRYDIAKFYGYNSPEEYDEAERRLHELIVESKKRQKLNVEKEPVKRGKWIRKEGYDPRDNFYYCSECNRIINVISGDSLSNYPYCHCGARMDGGDDDV